MKKLLLAVVLAVVTMFGAAGGSVAEAAEGATVGFVNLAAVYSAYPGIDEAQKTILAEQNTLQNEFNSKMEELSNKEKAKLQQELNKKLAEKQIEVMKPINEKISKSIAQAAQTKGLLQVVKAEAMLFGGVDLTQDVIALIK